LRTHDLVPAVRQRRLPLRIETSNQTRGGRPHDTLDDEERPPTQAAHSNGQVPASRGRDRHDIEYLRALPRVVPNGKVLVHDGLTYWLQNPSGGLEPCDCDWALDMGVHFRVCRRRA
jgi:hypothetical protein